MLSYLKVPVSENDLGITCISKMRKQTPRNSMAFLNVTDLVSYGSLFDINHSVLSSPK